MNRLLVGAPMGATTDIKVKVKTDMHQTSHSDLDKKDGAPVELLLLKNMSS